jgi:hypothetical protein
MTGKPKAKRQNCRHLGLKLAAYSLGLPWLDLRLKTVKMDAEVTAE